MTEVSEAFEDRDYWASLHQCAIDLLGRAEKAEAALQQQAREIERLKEILQFDPKSKAKTWAQAWSEADDEIERLRIRMRRLEAERDSIKEKTIEECRQIAYQYVDTPVGKAIVEQIRALKKPQAE